jgi:hypothetical protein
LTLFFTIFFVSSGTAISAPPKTTKTKKNLRDEIDDAASNKSNQLREEKS